MTLTEQQKAEGWIEHDGGRQISADQFPPLVEWRDTSTQWRIIAYREPKP